MDPNMIEALVRAEVAGVEAMTPAGLDRELAELGAAAELDREISPIVDEWKHRPVSEHLAVAEVLARITSALPATGPMDEESTERLRAALARPEHDEMPA